jgi:hypothetical protein
MRGQVREKDEPGAQTEDADRVRAHSIRRPRARRASYALTFGTCASASSTFAAGYS